MPAPRLQLSGQITLADIATFFLGSPGNDTALSKFYKTASGVYPNAVANPYNGAIPSSGQISIGNFYGASAYWGYMVISSTAETFAGPYSVPQSNGTITVTVTGPKSSYTIVIGGVVYIGTYGRRTGLPSSTYTVSVTDDAGAHSVGISLGSGGTYVFHPNGGF